HVPCPVPTTPLANDKRPPHFLAAACFAHETLLLLLPTGKRQRRLRPVQGGLREHPVAGVTLRDTPFQRLACGAARSSFLPSPDVRGLSQGKPPAEYQWIA